MPFKDGTGPDGSGPKKNNKGVPKPKRKGGGGMGKWNDQPSKRGSGQRQGGRRNK